MKRRSLFALALAIAAWALLLPSPARAGSGLGIEAVPSASSVLIGHDVEVVVKVTGLGDMAAPSLGASDLALAYDPALFAFEGLTPGPDFEPATTGSTAGAAAVDAFAVSLATPTELNMQQPGSFTLFTATFRAIGSGSGSFAPTLNAPLGDENGDPLATPSTVSATVAAASPISVPTASEWGLLLLAATLTLLGIRYLAPARGVR